MLRLAILLSIVVLYSTNTSAQIIVNLIDNFTLEPLKDHTVSCKNENLEIQRLSGSCFVINNSKKGAVLSITSPGYIIQHITLAEAKKELIDLVIQPGDSLLTAYRNSHDFYTPKAPENNVKSQKEAASSPETTSPDSPVQQFITTRPEKNVFNDSLKMEALESDDKVFNYPGTTAQFPGGEVELKKFIGTNIRYPQRAIELGIQGTVYIQFVVSKTGEVSKIRIVRGINLPIDAESARVIKKMPNWTPGTVDGKPVNSYYNLPIKFKLQ